MKKRMLALVLAALLVVLTACSSGGNDVSRAYDHALNSMKQGKFAEAADLLSGITFYEDSAKLSLYCQAQALAAEGRFMDAANSMQKMSGYRDASQCAFYYLAREAEEYKKRG